MNKSKLIMNIWRDHREQLSPNSRDLLMDMKRNRETITTERLIDTLKRLSFYEIGEAIDYVRNSIDKLQEEDKQCN